MEKFHLRPYKSSDAQAVVNVINVASMHTLGFPRAVVDAVGNLWAYKFILFTCEKIVAVDNQDKVIGYAFFINNDNIASEMGETVHPEYWGQGVGSDLIEWAESRAMTASQNAPNEVKTVLQTSLFDNEQDAQKLFKAHGFSPAREWVHLVIEMKEPPVIPSLPSNFVLREMDLDND